MTRVASYTFYMMIDHIYRTVSTILKYVLLISEIGSCVIHVFLPGYMNFMTVLNVHLRWSGFRSQVRCK